jgi:hypothetical protein
MIFNTLRTILVGGAALALTACVDLAQRYEAHLQAASTPLRIVSGPAFDGKQSAFGPLKPETAELRERLKDPKNFYRYEYAELWIAGAFPIDRRVVVFAATGRPLRSGDEIGAAAQCYEADIRKSVSSGEQIGLRDKKLLLPRTGYQELQDWHAQAFGKKEAPLGRACRINVMYDM